jgi:hypothetical protein
VQTAKYFAFRDPIKKSWDFSDALNISNHQVDDEERTKNHDLRQNIEGFWEFFQRANQAMFIVDGLVRFDSIVVIDGEGDRLHRFPHIYVDFQGDRGPFADVYNYLEISEHSWESVEGLKRTKKFPSTFPPPRIGVVYRDKTIALNDRTRALLKSGSSWVPTIYDCDDRYQFLNPGDVIGIEQTQDRDGTKDLIKITHKRREHAADLLKRREDDPMMAHDVEDQIGRKLEPNDLISVYEFKVIYEWQLEMS